MHDFMARSARGPALSALLAAAVAAAFPDIATAATGVPVVAAVAVSGNTHVPSDRILNVLATKAGDPFDPQRVQHDVRAIIELGFFAAEDPPTIVQRRDGVVVTFRVREHPVVRAIHITGNAHVADATLMALIDTAPGQVFNDRTSREDALKIDSYYDHLGFGGQVPTHVNGIEVAPDGVVTVAIREGVTVRAVRIAAAPQADPYLPEAAIRAALIMPVGTVYSDTDRARDQRALEKLYAKHGLKIAEIDSGIDPATIDAHGTGVLVYGINVVRVGVVQITGDTKTHDDVIRSELRLRPGMVVTDAALEHDRRRINNLGLFANVEVSGKPGPDPAHPGYVTLDWHVKEQKTATFMLGGGYSGGATGTGLSSNISVTENDLNGTGNALSAKLQEGSQITDAELSYAIRHLGTTPASQKYSLTTSLFSRRQVNGEAVYPAAGSSTTPGTPVSLIPATSSTAAISNVYSTYSSRSSGVNATLGRSLSDTLSLSAGVTVESIAASASLPSGYYFPTTQALNPLSSTLTIADPNSTSTAIGVSAPSIAPILSTRAYAVHSLTLGIASDTRDDIANPLRGSQISFSDEISSPSLGSDFAYQALTLDVRRFFPIAHRATLAVHAMAGATTGAVPTSKLFIFSDQQLRGYTDAFYGTDALLGQAELRIPLSPDRGFELVPFVDAGATRIRGGTAVSTTGALVDLNPFTVHADAGLGVRFSIPQFGLKSLRLDFAKGSTGSHISFGFGQDF